MHPKLESCLGPAADRARRCLIIGEIAQAHDGSLGTAHAYIDAVANAGADAVKFQTHIASAESTAREPWRVRFSSQDATRYDYWRRMEFSEEQWHRLRRHAEERDLIFLSSPFSLEAVDLLSRVGMVAWKIASGEVASERMLARMAETRCPLLFSTGMSNWTEIDRLVDWCRSTKNPFALMQCTTAYPCPPDRVGLNLLTEFRQRYQCPVGLSDHSGTIFPGLAAATLGGTLVEVHVTFSRECFGPDVPASITPAELKQLVDGVRFIEQMNAHPVCKDEAADATSTLRGLFTKSIVAQKPLPAGTILESGHLTVKKPGDGIPERRLNEFVGRQLKKALMADERLLEEHLE